MTRQELRGPSGRLYGYIVDGVMLEFKRGGCEAERIDLRPYLEAARLCDNGREEVHHGRGA